MTHEATSRDVMSLAIKASCSVPTVRRYLSGATVRPSIRQRLDWAAAGLGMTGLVPPEGRAPMRTFRKTIHSKLRFNVLERDGFRCVYCGVPAGTSALQVDHVVPVSLGGPTELSNLVTACVACNQGKGDRSIAGSQPGSSADGAESK